ncbi:TlpA family protein disulfide reductase [Flavobacterium pectinovorum]|uniref:TlpA family protein disulfide reductase n=1 Tax=Flavobacterium pectinovorum TaxID=29533 RepID=UPI001FAB697D|nr:TlpA disulfide reductase family protein [Flavobacterium pectinovorum]MCI9846084.1 TlpA family protein disulfide reductase [Flavobacterium pectinovorum]
MKKNQNFAFLFIKKTAIFLFFVCSISAVAQKAILKGKFEVFKNQSIRLLLPGHFLDQERSKSKIDVKVDETGSFYQELNLSKSEIIYFQYFNPDSKSLFAYNLFVTPGDNLIININNLLIKVEGKQKENNQFLDILSYVDLTKYKGDTLPDRVYKEIERITLANKSVLEKYITANQPSKDFIKTWQANLEYLAPQSFYSFEQNNKYKIKHAYARNLGIWKQYRNELFSNIKINNDEAINAPVYQVFIHDILLRTKEELWKEASGENQESFYKEWYNTSIEEGSKLLREDMTNSLTEKIIKKYYSNKSAEFAYAVLFTSSIEDQNYKNVPEIFENFKKQFPTSVFIEQFQPKINKIIENNNKILTDKMVFVPKGEELKTFEEVINHFKGKTVLIDMWGTWCAPCRKEIAKHSQALHEYFKDKDLQFLYIANHDSHNSETWKKTISFQSIEGSHILANEDLTKDIMSKSKGSGFPTYIILKKDGSYELSKAGYPLKKAVLIEQLEAAIAE